MPGNLVELVSKAASGSLSPQPGQAVMQCLLDRLGFCFTRELCESLGQLLGLPISDV
jgi:hypothetical protein